MSEDKKKLSKEEKIEKAKKTYNELSDEEIKGVAGGFDASNPGDNDNDNFFESMPPKK